MTETVNPKLFNISHQKSERRKLGSTASLGLSINHHSINQSLNRSVYRQIGWT